MAHEDDVLDIKEATKQAIAEIKADQLAEKELIAAKDEEKLNIKQMVKDAMDEAQAEVQAVEVKRVTPSFTSASTRIEVKEAGYSRHNYSSHVGYKSTELDQAYDDGMWYKAAILGDPIATKYCNDMGIEIKALTSLTGSSGGHTVPEQLLNRIIIISNQYGILRSRTNKFQATTGTMLIPKNGTDCTATFTLENVDKTESDPGFDQVEVTIKKLAVATLIPMELIADSVIDIISYVVDNMGKAIAKKEDVTGFYGNGSTDSGGMIGIIPAIDAVEGNQSIVNPVTDDNTWTSIAALDFDNMEGQLNEAAWEAGDVAYFCSNSFYHKVFNPAKREGGSSIVEVETGYVKKFNGIEVVTSSIFPNTPNENPSDPVTYCLLGSLKTVMAFADRMGKTIKSTSEGKTLTLANQTLIVTEQRFGLTVHDQGTASEAGSMISLRTA